MKVIVVETDEMDNRANRIVFTSRISPASISRIVEKRMNSKVKNVCVVFTNGDELNLSPEEWADRKIVDDPDLNVASPDTASRPDGAIDAHNVIPSASCCRIAIGTIISACEAGVFDAGNAQVAEPVKTLIESHNKCLALIKGRAEEAYKHAGGKR